MSRYDDIDSPDYNDTNVGEGMVPSRAERRQEALERDAARYRWLRTSSPAMQAVGRQNVMLGNFGDALDAAVDAAMRGSMNPQNIACTSEAKDD